MGLTLKKLVSEIYIGIKFTQFQIIYLDFNQITVWKIGILLVLSVDECAGDKTPFPYNRVDTKGNPIFSIVLS
jgi:hypothetical protein